MNKKIIIEVFGWYGALAIMSAYFLNSFSFLSASDVSYQILNVTGSLGMISISYYKRAYQPLAINILWVLIASLALVNLLI